MKDFIEKEYLRMGIISEIIEQTEYLKIGKTKLQKLIYLAQYLNDIKLGYHFSLYNYGPYCEGLVIDTENVLFRGYIESQYKECQIHFHRTKITIRTKIDDLVQDYREMIETLVRKWGKYQAKDLEIITTMLFIDNEIYERGKSINKEDFMKKIKTIKPKYSDFESMHNILVTEGLFKNTYEDVR